MANHDDPEQLLTYGEVARRYGFRPQTLRVWVARGRVPHLRLGRRFVRFEPEAIAAWIAERRVPARTSAD